MKRALVIIDIQKGFLNKNTAYLEEKIAEFIKTANGDLEAPAFDLVIGTAYVNHPETACYRFENWKACMAGSEEAGFSEKLLPLLSVDDGAPCLIRKDQYTCYTADFLRLIRGHEIDMVYMCGVNTGCCVLHSALDAYENLVETVVLKDLCGSTTGPHYHEIAIELLETLITKDRVIGSEKFLEDIRTEGLVKKAESMAELAHKGQKNKAGRDYFEHLRAVANGVEKPEEKIVAFLHDTLEDTALSEHVIEDLFGENILAAVKLLTRAGGEGYFEYVERIAENPMARTVKISDLTHNLDLSRIPEPSEKDLERYLKYRKALKILENKA